MQKFISKTESRLNKFLADQGVCSRREADKLIEDKKIKINGRYATIGSKVFVNDVVEVLSQAKTFSYKIYYKPRGEVTGESVKEKLAGLHPLGRLDKESEGLLIYTDDYRLSEALLDPKNKIEKEYRVMVREKATPRVERIMLSGMYTQEAEYSPAKKVFIHEDRLTIDVTLTEGKKHEIRRMLNALNLTVKSLKRVKFANLNIKNLYEGQIKDIEGDDLAKLLSLAKLNS